MKVKFEHISGRTEPRETDLPHVPRSGEYVDINGKPYRVQVVIWSLADGEDPSATIRYADDR